jgi:hypothetical protein
MVVRLEASEAFVILLKEKDYNIPQSIERCRNAERMNIPMYLIAIEGADTTPLANFSWRTNGVFRYRYDAELMKIWQKIRADLKYIRDVGT